MDARTHTAIFFALVGVLLLAPKSWAEPPQRLERLERSERGEQAEQRVERHRSSERAQLHNGQGSINNRGDRSDREGRELRDRQQGHLGGYSDSREAQRDRSRLAPSYFHEEHREIIRNYYGQTYLGAHRCPPGLAKKNNGCMPPGQAKLWRRGYVLPREVIYYDVEPDVLVRLGPPPSGHRFVRVAGDILLIAIGTGLVMDAIEDLGR